MVARERFWLIPQALDRAERGGQIVLHKKAARPDLGTKKEGTVSKWTCKDKSG